MKSSKKKSRNFHESAIMIDLVERQLEELTAVGAMFSADGESVELDEIALAVASPSSHKSSAHGACVPQRQHLAAHSRHMRPRHASCHIACRLPCRTSGDPSFLSRINI